MAAIHGSTANIRPSATEPDTATACSRTHPLDMVHTLPTRSRTDERFSVG
ncbi:hypothetical protein GCM10027184_77980 [Saccharothrix stipae]